MATDQPGMAAVPTIGAAPEALTAAPEGGRPSLWPPVPRRVLIIRMIIGVLLAVAALWAPFYFEPSMNRVLSQAIYIAIAAMGLNLLTGFNGQVSIGHGAFYGVGAFTSAILMIDHGWTFEPTILVAAALSGGLGVLVGVPALRVRGLYLALVTLGLAVLFPLVTQKYVDGSGGVPLLRPSRREFASLIDGLADDQWAYFLSLAVMVVLFFLAWNMVRGRMGRAMIAVRDQEIAASTVGVNLAATKVGTFAISAAYCGLAGSLTVLVEGQADASSPLVYFQHSIFFLIAVVVGGTATVGGPIIGGLAVQILDTKAPEWGNDRVGLAAFILGVALVAIVYVLPGGILGGLRQLSARIRGGGRATPEVPPPDPVPNIKEQS